MTNNAGAACPKRGAHGDLLPSHRAAREEKIRDIGISDQQQANDRAEEHVKSGANIADQLFSEWLDTGLQLRIRLGIFLFQGAGDGLQLRVGLRDGDARLQASDALK